MIQLGQIRNSIERKRAAMPERSFRRTAQRHALLVGTVIAAVAVILMSIALGLGVAPEMSMFAGP